MNASGADTAGGGWDDLELLAGLEAASVGKDTDRFDPEGVPTERRLVLAQELLDRGWIEVSHPLRGDGELIAVRGARLTQTGVAMHTELRQAPVADTQEADAGKLWRALQDRGATGSKLERSIQEALGDLTDRGMLRSGPSIRRAHQVADEHGLVWESATDEFVPEYLMPPKLDTDQRAIITIAAGMFVQSGEWPAVRDVVRTAVRDMNIRDPQSAISALPKSAGHSDSVRLVLTAEGLAAANVAEDLLEAFVQLARIAAESYLGDADDPTISSSTVRDALGVDEDTLAKLHTLVSTESFFLGSGHSNSHGWEYEVTQHAAQLRSCVGIDDYLRTRRAITRRPPMPAPTEEGLGDVRAAAVRRVGLERLHPAVLAAASDLFTDGHYSQAIFEALKALEVRVRDQSSVDASGRDLMSRAFKGHPPAIDLRHEDGQSGRDEQEGFRFIFMGAIQGIRNPKGHELVRQDRPDLALEYLALVSLLFHRLDGAQNAVSTASENREDSGGTSRAE